MAIYVRLSTWQVSNRPDYKQYRDFVISGVITGGVGCHTRRWHWRPNTGFSSGPAASLGISPDTSPPHNTPV